MIGQARLLVGGDPHRGGDLHPMAEVFGQLGASVDERIYRGMGHTISRDEIEAVRDILA